MKKTLYAFIFMLSCLNFNLNFAQESDDYESISLTADDYQALTSLNQNFIQAVKDNDLNKTEQLISQGADINYQDELGNTAAHYAFSANPNFFSAYTKMRGALFVAQANLNIPNAENKTANDFCNEVKFPLIDMNTYEIAEYIQRISNES
jgi:ankyrin repeat protein